MTLTTTVKLINPYGSVQLEICDEDFQAAGFEFGDITDVLFENGYELKQVPYHDGFYVKRGKPIIVSYSEDPNPYICRNYINMAAEGKLEAGMKVYITLIEKGTRLSIQKARSIKYTNTRSDYSTDDVFANARMVRAGNMKEGILFRSASPFDPSIQRYHYADDFIERNHINTILDISDDEERIKGYVLADADEENDYTLSPYALGLIKANRVIPVMLTIDYQSDPFLAKLVRGLERMAEEEGPYLVNCLEGKDRTGFVCALLEALSGADYESIAGDYMVTFDNYFKINIDNAPVNYYMQILENVDEMLRFIMEMPFLKLPDKHPDVEEARALYYRSVSDFSEIDMEARTIEFLQGWGMKTEAIMLLRDKLTK